MNFFPLRCTSLETFASNSAQPPRCLNFQTHKDLYEKDAAHVAFLSRAPVPPGGAQRCPAFHACSTRARPGDAPGRTPPRPRPSGLPRPRPSSVRCTRPGRDVGGRPCWTLQGDADPYHAPSERPRQPAPHRLPLLLTLSGSRQEGEAGPSRPRSAGPDVRRVTSDPAWPQGRCGAGGPFCICSFPALLGLSPSAASHRWMSLGDPLGLSAG